jgi:hypothetical protein
MILAHEDKTYAPRGHYESVTGRDVHPFIRATEGFATSTQLLAEQVWALPDQPMAHMVFGHPTGDVMPPNGGGDPGPRAVPRDNTGAEAALSAGPGEAGST